MTLNDWLKTSGHELKAAGLPSSRLDSLIILEFVIAKDRAWILAHLDEELAEAQLAKLNLLLAKRRLHLPIPYIVGKTEFYGRQFIISPDVLVPRPESETMIDILKSLPISSSLAPSSDLRTHKRLRIADVGTGSGALGITAALELCGSRVDLIDIDERALEVAKSNVVLFTLNLSVIRSDLLKDSPSDYDILLCNLPYVPDSFHINQAAGHEPSVAIFGGPDGLDLYRKLFEECASMSHKPLYILCEALPPQHKRLKSIAQKNGFRLKKVEDFIQVFTAP